jgi:hypothetical protein
VEIRTIDEKLHQAELSHLFKIEQHWAVRVRDLQGLILRHKPNIIHFSGHGSKDSGIVLEDETGNSRAVSAQALGKMFSVLKDNISCVILNSCYSESQARAIADHIDYVIGMSEAITDAAAISFSCAFYQAMGYGRDLGDAFDLGCIQIDLENLEEHDTPKLFLKGEMTEPTRTTIDIVTVGSSFLSSLGKALQLANSVQREFGFHLLENELTILKTE